MQKSTGHQDDIIQLFNSCTNDQVQSIDFLGTTASNRSYYRLFGKYKKKIGVYHNNISENKAFISFSEHFRNLRIHVPLIYAKDLSKNIYLIEDLGDHALFDLLNDTNIAIPYYKKALSELIVLQTKALKGTDLSLCTPRASLDYQSLLWDLNYFKYYFLKIKNILFDEQKLEDDFQKFIKYLLEADQNYFIHRDFQSRNILIHDGKSFLIDYQGGRKGPLQYDVVSLLFQVKAQLSDDIKDELLNFYLEELSQTISLNKKHFLKYYYPYALMRLMQVMGAYGYRGLYEKKSHFIESIPYAIKVLRSVLLKINVSEDFPELFRCLKEISKLKEAKKEGKLTVHIKSFAYKHGIPKDNTGHGEGFVFDCRFLPNPGRLEAYQSFSGKDQEVISYLKNYPEVHRAIDQFIQISEQAITNYLEREFDHLSINFGCTGGQHRSVYCAEALKKHLQEKYLITVKLEHTQKHNWKKTKYG